MTELSIKLNEVAEKQIEIITDYLKRGQVIVYPTDTIYGLGCLATDAKAVKRISRIKKRSPGQPYIILVASLAMVRKYAYINKKQVEYLKKIWPGPVTVVFKSRGNLPTEVTAGKDTIAIRLPKNKFLAKIIKRVKAPIISTSLNISGQKEVKDLARLDKYFNKLQPDLVINSGAAAKKRPSKLIDITDINHIKILRP